MSVLPEAKLAREAEIAYQMICMSTDYDCWHSESESVNVALVMGHMKANAVNARRFVGAVLDELSKEEHVELVAAGHLNETVKYSSSTHEGKRGADALNRMEFLFPGYF
jgi:5'-methylthioadenosine phosphorylase